MLAYAANRPAIAERRSAPNAMLAIIAIHVAGVAALMSAKMDLPARIADLKEAGLHFRNEMEAGPGGKQVQIEDPDGNPIELFEPARH